MTRRRLGLLVAALLSSAAHGAGVSGLGDGRDGDLVIDDAGVQIDDTRSLMTDAPVGASLLEVSTTSGLSVGDVVLLYQATDVLTVDAGPDPIDLTPTGAGRYELALVATVGSTSLTLTAPLASAFPAARTQLMRVPQYRAVFVQAGGSLVAPAWDGARGGVLALFSMGPVQNDGLITAAGRGFRGGAYVNQGICAASMSLDEDAANARKGEGLVVGNFGVGVGGRGNVANGAGGGNSCNAGGGGGGNAGVGGRGGWSAQSNLDVGGFGGAPLSFAPRSRWPFGGGGGAGQANQDRGAPGGNGGGVVFVTAKSLSGAGVITAQGDDGPASSALLPSDGAGGGGAGGVIDLRLSGTASCGSLSANGGNGGDTLEFQPTGGPVGPGGGGAGGWIFREAAGGGACAATALAGHSGTQPDPGWALQFGATPLLDAGAMPQHEGVAIDFAPFDAGVDAGTADAGAADAGTADAGSNVDGGLADAGGGSDGGVPDAGPDGGAVVDAGLLDAGFGSVDAGPGRAQGYQVGCGCSTADALVWGMASATLILRRRRQGEGGARTASALRRQP